MEKTNFINVAFNANGDLFIIINAITSAKTIRGINHLRIDVTMIDGERFAIQGDEAETLKRILDNHSIL